MKLLLVEDNEALRTTVARSLARRGFALSLCGDGAQALARWHSSAPDVVLLDLSLPGLDGLNVLQQARAQGLHTPVLVLTARGTVGDRVLGLNSGADDYLAKPFDLDELEARIQALMRRSRQPGEGPSRPVAFAGLHVDADSGAVYHQGQVLDLTSREAALLRALLHKPGQAVTKERLTQLVFAHEAEVADDAIEVVVYRLRKKLAGIQAQLITLRGLGYLLRAEEQGE
jgi:two-component system, OmpR family, response regulator TctD